MARPDIAVERPASDPLRSPPVASPKLRRLSGVEGTLIEASSSRRLVEYFVVVSSHPRWESRLNTPIAMPSPTRQKVSKRHRKLAGQREQSQNGIEVVETREEAPPAPSRNTWKRDEPDTEGNIHLPVSSGHEYTFQPKITARYPPTDYPDHALNPLLTQFCYPHSDVIVPSSTYVMPRIHHFVLTNDKGRKVYGTCLTLYEEYHPNADEPFRKRESVHSDSGERDIEVTAVSGQKETLYIPRVLCLVSTWPYLTAFREYLTQIYRLATTTNLMTTPIERYILNICMEIPAPPPGAFEIHVSILNSTIRFWAPPAKLPVAYVALPYQTLFDCLDIDNILTVWYALVLERNVLLLSSQYSILTVCSEILCSLLFPMQWTHLYIPLVPRFLNPMLEAPFPYLCGVIRENWIHAKQFVNEETIIVDLDRNKVTFGERTREMTPVPIKKWGKLRESLELTAGHLFWETRGLATEHHQLRLGKLSQDVFDNLKDQDGNPRWEEKLRAFDEAFNLAYTPDSPNLLNDTSKESQQSQWDKVQESFLRFFVSLLKSYRQFLHMPENSTPNSPPRRDDAKRWSSQRSFDRDGFIAWQKADHTPFIRELSMTQHFDDFITKRLYSPGEPDVIFFDQSIDAKLNRSRFKLKKVDTAFLHNAKAHKVLNKVSAVAPNDEGLSIPQGESQRAYIYKSWPETFDPKLFGSPRPIPSIITAEFDRQTALVARLRASYTKDSGADRASGFHGGDCDTSPEVATFTVFFFTYSAVIGREWQEYQRKRLEMEITPFDIIDQHSELIEERDPMLDSERYDEVPVTYSIGDNSLDNRPATGIEHTVLTLVADCHSGMVSVAPDCSGATCEQPCPEYGPSVKFSEEFLAQWQQFSTHSGEGDPRDASLLDFDDTLAEFEEAKEVAAAQLDLAFSVLTTMSLRGLSIDSDGYKSLMEACGRCGDTDRAFQLLEMMKRDGLGTDQEVYASVLKAFAQDGAAEAADSGIPEYSRKSDAYSEFLKKKLEMSKTTDDGLPHAADGTSSDDGDSDGGSILSAETDKTGSFVSDWYSAMTHSLEGFRTPQKKPKTKMSRRRRRKSTLSSSKILGSVVTDGVRRQIVLGDSLLDFLYPDLVIDTNSDSCPQCSHVLAEDDIVAGWHPCEFQDYTTGCPQCKHRLVPHFSVRCSAPTFQGSQGRATPLYCEFLSPWVLRQELEHFVHGPEGIDGILAPEWRSGTDIQATLWWNMIVTFVRYRLPVSFLLQGSFQNRLINPTPDA